MAELPTFDFRTSTHHIAEDTDAPAVNAVPVGEFAEAVTEGDRVLVVVAGVGTKAARVVGVAAVLEFDEEW